MPIELAALGSVVAVSAVSLAGAALLLLRASVLQRLILFLVSLAVGALFGDALLHLIPEAFAAFENTSTAALFVLGGIVGFFALEKFLHWRHSHGHENGGAAEGAVKPLGYLVLISDGIHNFLDGIIIAASYFVSAEVGIATTVAVMLHEIPQEFSDLGVLMHAGFTRGRALLMNFCSALAAVAGAILIIALGSSGANVTPALIALGAGGFLYIAGSDLVPELHKTQAARHSFVQFAAILLGIGAMFALLLIEG